MGTSKPAQGHGAHSAPYVEASISYRSAARRVPCGTRIVRLEKIVNRL